MWLKSKTVDDILRLLYSYDISEMDITFKANKSIMLSNYDRNHVLLPNDDLNVMDSLCEKAMTVIITFS